MEDRTDERAMEQRSMHLKYYMRGVGTGVLFTLFVFLVIIIPNIDLAGKMNNDKPDKQVVEDSNVSGLLGRDNTQTEVKDKAADATTPAPVTEAPTDNSVTVDAKNNEVPAGDPVATATPIPKDEATAVITTVPPQPATPTPVPAKQETVSDNKAKAVIKITDGVSSEAFCKQLEMAGIVDSWRDINNYIISKGVDRKIRNGSFSFTEGMTYDEICDIVTGKK